jgi:RNA polymerase sigma factor (sigma-70 family)
LKNVESKIGRRELEECRSALLKDGPNSPIALRIFQALFDEYFDELRGRAHYKYGLSYADSLDVLILTYVRAWRWLNSASTLCEPRSMLNRCLSRAYPDFMRELYGRHTAVGEAEYSEPGIDPRWPLSLERSEVDLKALIEMLIDKSIYGDTEAAAEHREVALDLHLAMAKLPTLQFKCIWRKYFLRMSVAEISRDLDLSLQKIRTLEAHALANLRVLLSGGTSTPDQTQ